ncbi:hypothetical protein EDB82DRAFT_347953 [Fusarium venenatum]|uniref:uncharacterized protein n=1 Tax=Fusarium venenatum TaxID=56646 RepID=UPI001D50ADD1|nr:hypothetical protein EDB82DRAFT_347953 [Fusarium venenatum]
MVRASGRSMTWVARRMKTEHESDPACDTLLTSLEFLAIRTQNCQRCCCLFPRVIAVCNMVTVSVVYDVFFLNLLLIHIHIHTVNTAMGLILPALCQYQSLFRSNSWRTTVRVDTDTVVIHPRYKMAGP